MSGSPGNVTELLNRASDGDPSAARDLLPVIYGDLRRLAHGMMAKLPPGQTLQPTALVHEAFLRMVGREDLPGRNRAQFFLVAARAMHDIIVEQARRKSRLKHGGDLARVELTDIPLQIDIPQEDILALDAALERIEASDPQGHRIIMLRFFAGFTVPEIARILGLSLSTIERRWRFLRAVLARELAMEGGAEDGHVER